MIQATRSPFDTSFDVIDKGSGKFMGALEDITLSEGSTLSWVAPRRILKAPPELPLKGGMVIQSARGHKYMVAEFAQSETSMGSPFTAYKLYEATSVMQYRCRSTTTDIRTGLEKEGQLTDPVDIYAQVEPQQEAFDRQLRIPNEKLRIITNEPVEIDQLIDGQTIIEVHEFQGLYGVILS